MLYDLRLKRTVQKDFKRIGKEAAGQVMRAIREKLLVNPKSGKQLRGELADLWSLRSGDYRIIYAFNDAELWVLVVSVGHRKNIYKRL